MKKITFLLFATIAFVYQSYAQAPPNDDCANATPIACGGTASGSTVNATDSGGTASPDVFYSLAGATSGDAVTVSLCGSTYDTRLEVFDACGGTVLESNDDSCGLQSEVSFVADGVTTYIIRVEGFGTASGDYSLAVTCTGPPPPPACGENFYDTGGPSGNYSSGESYSVTISPDNPGEVVTITFTSVDIESSTGGGNQDGCWDYLTIYDGPTTASPVLAQTLCGEESGDGGVPSVASSELNVGDSFTSTDASGALTIEFNSDASVTETGWEADVTCNVLSVNEFDYLDSFTYYPNPVKNTLTLNAQNNIENVRMYNMLGQEVMRVQPQTVDSELDMSGLETGTYFVQVTIANVTKTVRVVKQ
ncbi:T9SS type A sorting domain-containing protein [Winogradskyella alexanderae]|uniref:T9SS type A sorting domain-containing protein n=1 Tax=Winogradskyella alexanderae TaxID=2877123 RepID=A0ABS7XUC9_9FLAO|nr:T9SS type A sorting domain-containing protein [Winogradskyella alexanderae]MCA0133079.1 T9SS type A sorting domain-containing protein [Winogradskyella alexanderae]